MQTIRAPKLLEILLAPPKRPVLRLILSDEGLFRRLALTSLNKLNQGKPATFIGKSAVAECVSAASEGSLFAPAPPALIELPPTLTAKQWESESKPLERLPKPPENTIYVFGPTALRNIIKSDAIFGESFLCYNPDDAEARRCLETLIVQYPGIAKLPREKQEALCHLAVEYYGGDLAQCDMHLERMEKTGVDFDAAVTGQTEANGFQVVDAVATGNPALIELRLQQCLMSGESIGAILKAIAAFLRQLSQVQAALEQQRNLDSVFQEMHIRVPMQQARLRKAMPLFTPDRIAAFCFLAPTLELELRTHRRPFEWLSHELAGLVRPGGR